MIVLHLIYLIFHTLYFMEYRKAVTYQSFMELPADARRKHS